jgi:mannitol/fructose-specific phosphotransferase system IIA component (Ntr-type)/CBS domain-containing protein
MEDKVSMNFENILSEDQILYIKDDIDYCELLNKAIDRLKNLYNFEYSKEECLQAILDRDKLGNTAFKEGFAIPHARFVDIQGVHFVVVKTDKPVSVPQPNGDKDINVFAIFIVSKSSPNLYLRILSTTIKLLSMKKGKYLEQIKQANSMQDVYRVFKESDLVIKHKIKVQDIMNPRPVIIKPDDSIKEVMNRLYLHQSNTAYVVDNKDNLVGYVSISLLLKRVIPDYLDFLDGVSFVKEFQPFEKLLREESTALVSEVMDEIEHTLEPESSILEAAYYLTKHPKVNIPVVEEDGRLCGTISPKAFLNKILRS